MMIGRKIHKKDDRKSSVPAFQRTSDWDCAIEQKLRAPLLIEYPTETLQTREAGTPPNHKSQWWTGMKHKKYLKERRLLLADVLNESLDGLIIEENFIEANVGEKIMNIENFGFLLRQPNSLKHSKNFYGSKYEVTFPEVDGKANCDKENLTTGPGFRQTQAWREKTKKTHVRVKNVPRKYRAAKVEVTLRSPLSLLDLVV